MASSGQTDKEILCVVGARPNFTKIAPIMRALGGPNSTLRGNLVHTGQHYDEAMKESFFRQLDIPEPDVDLGVGSGSHAVQTAQVMMRFEPILDERAPAAVLVVGDVNSTIACALVAAKKGIPVIHVEAGLRSYDRAMPEEINRVLTDQLSDLLFTTERSARENLIREGIDPKRIEFVGNVMIDTLRHNLPKRVPLVQTLAAHGVAEDWAAAPGIGLVTMHRPSNVDVPEVLERLLRTLAVVSERLPLVMPLHPRTAARIAAAGLGPVLDDARILVLEPLGYLEMLGVMAEARVVLTDSGGIQEETTALGVPCITMRENTERPITVAEGTNTVVGTNPERILAALERCIEGNGQHGRIPEYWDGAAAERIVGRLQTWLGS